MIYYRVRKEYANIRKSPKDPDILIANELYTKSERKKMIMTDEAFERVSIPRKQTYWFFGARFAKTESQFTKTPVTKGI